VKSRRPKASSRLASLAHGSTTSCTHSVVYIHKAGTPVKINKPFFLILKLKEILITKVTNPVCSSSLNHRLPGRKKDIRSIKCLVGGRKGTLRLLSSG
jgi:hypothetical protein